MADADLSECQSMCRQVVEKIPQTLRREAARNVQCVERRGAGAQHTDESGRNKRWFRSQMGCDEKLLDPKEPFLSSEGTEA